MRVGRTPTEVAQIAAEIAGSLKTGLGALADASVFGGGLARLKPAAGLKRACDPPQPSLLELVAAA